MPDQFAPTETDHLILTERIRVLACVFEIRTNAVDLHERLAYLSQQAEQDVPVEQTSVVEVMWTGAAYRISDETGFAASVIDLADALESLYERMHRRALATLSDHVRIHAASGMHQQRLFMMVGPKYAGKTTLALRLVAEGYDVTGDELVLYRDGSAMTFPRKFYVRVGSLALLPELRALTQSAPFVNNPTDGRVIAVDPIRLGKPWRIAPAPVSAIFFIEPNHGAATTMAACPKVEMVRQVVAECTPPSSGRADWLADLCRMVNAAETVTLRLGELDSAMLAMARILR